MNYKKMAHRADVMFGYTHWKWWDGRPSRPRLEKTIRQLVANIQAGSNRVETGRLLALREENEPGDTAIKVCIIIGEEHWGQH